MRHKGFTIVELAIVIFIVVVIAALLMPLVSPVRPSGQRSSCQSNLKQIGLGILQYTQDYDERLPSVTSNAVATTINPKATIPYGWADAIQPYIKSTQIYHCPTLNKETSWTDKNPQSDGVLPFYVDYYYNTNLDRVFQKNVPFVASTILCGEGNDGTDGSDARYNRNVVPQKWIDTENSPARRHLDTANYLFADGHVKTIKPDKVKVTRKTAGDYHFSLR